MKWRIDFSKDALNFLSRNNIIENIAQNIKIIIDNDSKDYEVNGFLRKNNK